MKLTILLFGLCASVAVHAVIGTMMALLAGTPDFQTKNGADVFTLTVVMMPGDNDADKPPVAGIAATSTPEAERSAAALVAPAKNQPLPPPLSETILKPEPWPVEPLETAILREAFLKKSVSALDQRSSTTAAVSLVQSRHDLVPEIDKSPGIGRQTAPLQPAGRTRAEPHYSRNPAPHYPLAARRLRQEGVVLLRVDVTTEGRAGKVEIEQSSGFPTLDKAALRAVQRWKFQPARIDSIYVDAVIQVPVHFKMAE